MIDKNNFFYTLVVSCLLVHFHMKVICMETSSVVHFPKPNGQYAVGTKSCHVIDAVRIDPFIKDGQSFRELMIQIWYPTLEKIGEVPTNQYAPDAIKYWKAKLGATGTSKDELASLDSIFVHTKTDASLCKVDAPFPVIIFSPGFAQMRTQNTALCQNIASYGYIVVSIDYTHFSENVVFPDGRIIAGKVKNLDTKEKIQHIQDILVDDVASVLAKLKEMNDDPHFLLYEGFDLKNIGIVGHSVGGSTALFSTKRLNTIKAGINLDGGIFGDTELLSNFEKPFMHIIAQESVAWAQKIKNLPEEELAHYGFKTSADRDKVVEDFQALHAHQPLDVYRLVVDGAGHMSFSDGIFFKDNRLLAPLLHLYFGTGSLSGKRVTEITTIGITVFFDKYLKNNVDLNIEKVIGMIPEVEIELNPKQIF